MYWCICCAQFLFFNIFYHATIGCTFFHTCVITHITEKLIVLKWQCLLFQGWYIVTYALGIYHLNLFIAFLSPKIDPALDYEGTYLNNCQYNSYYWHIFEMCQPISLAYSNNVKCFRWRSRTTHKGKWRVQTIHPPTPRVQVLVFSDKVNNDCNDLYVLWLLQHSRVLAHSCHVFHHPLLYYHEETD